MVFPRHLPAGTFLPVPAPRSAPAPATLPPPLPPPAAWLRTASAGFFMGGGAVAGFSIGEGALRRIIQRAPPQSPVARRWSAAWRRTPRRGRRRTPRRGRFSPRPAPRPPATGCGGAAAGPGVDGGISPVWTVEALWVGGRGRSPAYGTAADRAVTLALVRLLRSTSWPGASPRLLVAFTFESVCGVVADAVNRGWTGAAPRSASGDGAGEGPRGRAAFRRGRHPGRQRQAAVAPRPALASARELVRFRRIILRCLPWSSVLAKGPTSRRPIVFRRRGAATPPPPSLFRAAINLSDPPPGRPAARPFVSPHLAHPTPRPNFPCWRCHDVAVRRRPARRGE